MIRKIKYEKDHYPFRQIICDLFGVLDLENIHLLNGNWGEKFDTEIKNDKRFLSCYDQFLKIIIQPLFNEKLIVQSFANLKIHVPGKKSVDHYHVDSDYGHDVNEFNIWLPLTLATGTRSIYIESEPGKNDHSAQEVDYGEFLIFQGSKLSHGSEINSTRESRLSLDFRVIEESLFKKNDLITTNMGERVPYFKPLHNDNALAESTKN